VNSLRILPVPHVVSYMVFGILYTDGREVVFMTAQVKNAVQ
jgi:hypothetical protein